MVAIPKIGGLLRRVGEEALGYGIGGAISSAVDPLLRAEVNTAWTANPNMPLSPDTAAAVAIEHSDQEKSMESEAAKSGISSDRFAQLKETIEEGPDLGSLYDLWRRGELDDSLFDEGLSKRHFADKWRDPLRSLKRVLLSADILADARQQGFIDENRQIADSGKQGISSDDADILFKLAGNPPGPETALQMLNRGIITEDTFRQIIAEGRTKTKYTDDLLQLRRQLLTPEQVAEMVLRERISFEEGLSVAEKWGLSEDDFRLLADVRGRPPGIEQGLQLLNRGVIDKKRFREIVARSDVRVEFTDELLALKRRLPTIIQIRQLVSAGAVSDDLAVRWLIEQGYDKDVAEGVVTAAKSKKTEKQRDLTLSTITTLYEAREIPRSQAQDWISQLGYDERETEALLDLHDARREMDMRERAISAIHTQYVTRRIAEHEARAALDGLGVAPSAQDDLFQIWDLEQESRRTLLTRSDVVKAFKLGIRDGSWASNYLSTLGYADEDIDLILRLAAG
jgi:hypothetical protein